MISLKGKKAFTLIELLVGISIITIIVLGATNLDYNRLSQKQNLDIFVNNIKTDFERVRNNALSGKGIGKDLDVPKEWKVSYSLTNSGTINSSQTSDGTSWTDYNTVSFPTRTFIEKIDCLALDGSITYTLTGSEIGEFIFNGININLGTDCSNTSKILEITIKNSSYSKKLLINSLNGLVEIK